MGRLLSGKETGAPSSREYLAVDGVFERSLGIKPMQVRPLPAIHWLACPRTTQMYDAYL